jgi:hypothetical protein
MMNTTITSARANNSGLRRNFFRRWMLGSRAALQTTAASNGPLSGSYRTVPTSCPSRVEPPRTGADDEPFRLELYWIGYF